MGYKYAPACWPSTPHNIITPPRPSIRPSVATSVLRNLALSPHHLALPRHTITASGPSGSEHRKPRPPAPPARGSCSAGSCFSLDGWMSLSPASERSSVLRRARNSGTFQECEREARRGGQDRERARAQLRDRLGGSCPPAPRGYRCRVEKKKAVRRERNVFRCSVVSVTNIAAGVRVRVVARRNQWKTRLGVVHRASWPWLLRKSLKAETPTCLYLSDGTESRSTDFAPPPIVLSMFYRDGRTGA